MGCNAFSLNEFSRLERLESKISIFSFGGTWSKYLASLCHNLSGKYYELSNPRHLSQHQRAGTDSSPAGPRWYHFGVLQKNAQPLQGPERSVSIAARGSSVAAGAGGRSPRGRGGRQAGRRLVDAETTLRGRRRGLHAGLSGGDASGRRRG